MRSTVRRTARRGAVSLDLVGLLVLGGIAAGVLWPQRDPVVAQLDDDARAVVNALLDGRRAARTAAKPLLVEVDQQARIVRVAVDRDGDGRVVRPEIVDEVILADGTHFGLPESVPSRPFGAGPVEGKPMAGGTRLLRLETAERLSNPSGFYLATTRALRAGDTHDDEVLAIELAGADGAVSAWHPDAEGWTRRF